MNVLDTGVVLYDLVLKHTIAFYELDIHESVHRNTIKKVTNKMQLYRFIYYS